MLEVVRLGEFAQRRPAQLSGGQQQRVALARALVNLPSALLLDEPLGALDLKLRQAMQLELKRIQREVGITFIFVTHDQEEALTMSDRIAVMSQGQVEQIGSPEEIYDSPLGVRRRLHRLGEPAPRHGRAVRATTSPSRCRPGSPLHERPAPMPVGSGHGDAAARRLHLTETVRRAAPATVTDLIFQGAAVRASSGPTTARSSSPTSSRATAHGRPATACG